MGLPTTLHEVHSMCEAHLFDVIISFAIHTSGTRLAMLLPGKSRQAAKGTWVVESA